MRTKSLLIIFSTMVTIGSIHAQSGGWNHMMGSPEYLWISPQGGGNFLAVGGEPNALGTISGKSGYLNGNTFTIRTCPQSCGELRSMSGSKPNDIYAGGASGSLIHWNGTAWSTVTSPTTQDITAICSTAPGHVWVFDSYGYSHLENGAWITNSIAGLSGYRCAWGSTNYIYAVCTSTPVRFHQTYSYSWDIMPNPTTYPINGIWGTSDSNIYTVGDHGTVLHYDGTNWSTLPSLTTQNLRAIWGSSPYDIYVVGANGVALYFNGFNWTVESMPPYGGVGVLATSVVGSADRVIAVGPGHPPIERAAPTTAHIMAALTFDGWQGPSLPPVTVSVDGGPRQTYSCVPTANNGGYIDITVTVNSTHTINVGAKSFKKVDVDVYVGLVTARVDIGGTNGGLTPGDINNDGVIDDTDLLDVINHFLSTTYRPADINGDGIVDDTDLLSVINHFLQ